MRASMVTGLIFSGMVLVTGCSDDDANTTGGTSSSSSASSNSSGGGNGGSGGDGGGGAGGAAGSGGGGVTCTAARETALGPIDMVSTGEVKELSTDGAAKTLYVDASAGGIMNQAMNPWIYLKLSSGAKVEVTDKTADASMEWDIAIKRPLLRTNSGDSGPGQGGTVLLDGKQFDQVTMADASGATFQIDDWFDNECNLQTDETGAIKTAFSGWYDYDMATMKVTPHPGVFLVRGGDGALYKLVLLDYYATADGGSGMSGGRYKLTVSPLQ